MKWSLLCVLGLFLLSKLLCGNAEEFREKATLTAQSLIIPAGGSVTLTCDVKESTDLKYEWFRQTSSEEKSIITDESGRAISVFKGGNYTCRAEGKTVTITESDSVTVRETVRNRITVTVQHSWSQIFTGETITLRCEIQGGEGKVWKYEWTAPNTNSPPTSSEYRISTVSVSHSGDYRCRGSSDYLLTGWSDAFRLTVSYKPRATLTAGTTIIPVGGSVTLTCSVQSAHGWKYEWFRRTQRTSEGQIRDQQNRDIRVSQGGIYRCRGTRGNPVYYTDKSDDVTIEITFSNKVVVKQQPNWPQIFRGETITLTCEVQEGGETTEWEYEWRGPRTPTQWTHNNDVTFRVSESSSGDYMCKSRRRDDSYSSTEWSEAFTLSVSNKTRATLTAGTTIIPVGGSVTLTCSVQSSDGWKYEWFRRTQTTSESKIRDQQNRDIRVSEGGIYRCRGTRGNPVYYTDISDDVTIEKTISNKVVVKQQPNWPQIFRGETITLTCEVQEGGETTEWEYEWRGPSTPTQWTHNNNVTFRVSESSSGDYMCKSRRRDDSYSSTEWSEAFTLSASNKPRATLTAGTTIIPVGGSVTLTCSVQSSDGWKYEWFRRTQRTYEGKIRDQQNRDIRVSQGGIYRCRGTRGNPVYYTDISDDVTIEKTISNKVVVKQQPNWPQIFRGETITLTCEVQEGGETTEWEYGWRGPSTPTQWTHNNDVTFRVSESSSGDYMCKSRRRDDAYSSTEWSEAFTLSASNKPKAKLRADNTAVPVGGSVTLTCSVNPSSSSGWKYYWYRDNTTVDVVSPSNGQINASQEGLYRCRGGRGNPVYYTEDSQEVHINTAVSGFGCERSSFIVPFIVGLVSGIIAVLLLMCCYKQIKEPCCNSLTQSQSTNQSSASQQTSNQNEAQVYSSLLHGDLSVYEPIRGSGNTGSADEYNNVTSGFQLEGLDKRSRHDGTEESSDYNNVNPESASGP
ncbi:Down syndrome cell adhesion molecule homolog [Simochromis diagramma]|uniref:Down syndrome cell adhesion molecule homolog n=1 Tax=Simochromis diagramma TaxID=43689 RepID=UPI001A7EBDDB|nr:Down syndrome cell adhesion molecule homolog [Simochromis diagramma]